MTSDDKKNQNLTPEQQQVQDASTIKARFTATDTAERLSAAFERMGMGPGSGPGGLLGKTNFENAQLNAILDVLEAANPSDLEAAGDALQQACKELNKAANALKKDAAVVDLKGEAGTEFQRYAAELATYTFNLASFANVVGAQMKVASEGLTSVRNARPPRDGRPDPKKPTEFPPDKRTADNEDYQKAVKAERDRQEAINQINRLASFYAVSEMTLAAQEPPKLPNRLKVDVPRPTSTGTYGADKGSAAPAVLTGASTGETSHADAPRMAGRTDTPSGMRPQLPDGAPAQPLPDTSMRIDTVATPPAPTLPTTSTPPPTPTGPPSGGTGPLVPPVAPGLPSQGRKGGGGRFANPPSVTKAGGPPQAVGRAGGGQSGPVAPRPTGPGQTNVVGRPTGAPTPAGPTGRPNVVGGPGQQPVTGRATSGTSGPMTGRAGGGPAPAVGRPTGIVGGTPQQRTASGPSGSGSRIPRGMVIGGEGSAQARGSAVRPGQSGVVGAPGAAGPRPAGRGTPSVNGVVGTPRGGVAPRAQRPAGKDEETTGSERPDYLIEDEETWAVRRRGAVPPVIN
ncbi:MULTISPECIES: hypothetical protein [Streptomyces]|uniref:Uncharacterized protein n=2 Tax=Streptomyces TaxID=1883 RepID=A0A124EC95_9ACTN|nr:MULTISPECIES: hypothetical protein [Streptomyces]KUH36921.1 hypothetical protein ATE80_20980 [Streptomyces kanasensis]UUS33245.1 hypothetical protein NRO40_22135 [Streptomyces changanensis]